MARANGKQKRAARPVGTLPRLLLALGWLLGALALLGLLEPGLWTGGLVGEAGFQLALAALLSALGAAWMRAWWPLAGLLASAAVLAYPLAPLYRPSRPTPQKGPLLRVAALHVARAPSAAALQRFLQREQPDALALSGVVAAGYGSRLGSYRVVDGGSDATATLLVQTVLLSSERRAMRAPSAVLRVGRCEARVVAVDLPSRTQLSTRRSRARELAQLARRQPGARSVWLGHFGSRAEAHDMHELLARQGLRDARLGHGRMASLPGALGFLGVPRMHVLVHGWISVRDLMTRPAITAGAQRGLTAVLELTEPRCRFDRSTPSE